MIFEIKVCVEGRLFVLRALEISRSEQLNKAFLQAASFYTVTNFY